MALGVEPSASGRGLLLVGGLGPLPPGRLVGALEPVAEESNPRLHVEVSRYPPVPHLLHLGDGVML